MPLEAQSPVLDTQQWIDLMLDRIDNDDVADGAPGVMFNDLSALAQWVLQYQQPGDFTDLAPGFEDIGAYEGADWRFAPASAQVTAAVASRAARMLRNPNNDATIHSARTLLGRQRDLTGDSFHPAAVRWRWSKCSLQVQRLI